MRIRVTRRNCRSQHGLRTPAHGPGGFEPILSQPVTFGGVTWGARRLQILSG